MSSKLETEPLEVNCPNCGGKITMPEDAQIGDIAICPDCRFDFEIVKIEDSNIQLVKAEPSSSDWGQ